MIEVPRSASVSRATRLALALAAALGSPAGAQVCTTEVSRFDAGPEGWTWTSGVGWSATGGHPGGFLEFVDRGPNFNGWVVAPAAYLGDWSLLDGNGVVEYDFRIFTGAPLWSGTSVQLSGPGGHATSYGPIFVSPTSWWHIEASLAEPFWAVTTGTWKDLLADVREVRVSLHVSSQAERTGFDNFRVRSRPVAFCTAGYSASGCTATVSFTGRPSASASAGFHLLASKVEGGRGGLFFHGTGGRQAVPWGNGTSLRCVAPPVARGGLLAGTGTAGLCDGTLREDLNARWCPTCPKPAHNPGPGSVVQAQLWYRDPLATSNRDSSLSNAIEFCVGP